MNKIYSFLLVFALMTITGCSDDFLILSPKGTNTENNFYQNEEEIFQGLIAAYDPLSWGGSAGQWSMSLGLLNAASDDCHAGGSDASDQPSWVAFDGFSMTPELGPQEGLWAKYYGGIARCNLLIEKMALLDNLDESFENRTLAEVKFLRAHYYFDLVRFFGNVILTLDRISPDEITSQVQATEAEVYAQIKQDLTDAYNTFELPTSVTPSEFGRVTKGAVTALLGKVILHENNEAEMGQAAALFEEVINSNLYALEDNYGDIFQLSNEWGVESIWEIQHSEIQSGGWENFVNGTEGNYSVQFFGMRDYVGPDFATGWSFCPVSLELVDVMANDPRFEHTIIDGNDLIANSGASYTAAFQNTDYFIRKYAGLQENVAPDGEPALNWGTNERVIRLADVYLMAAEALLRSGGDEGQARTYLNIVRSRVGLQPLSNSGDSLLEAVYRERRLELATEGHRYFDLIRTGKATEFLPGFQSGKNELLPIPQREIDLTSGSLQQNPGY